jgi:hypothetical protein
MVIDKVTQYVIAVILYIIAYIYAIMIAPKITTCTTNTCKVLEKNHRKCLISTPALAPVIGGGRGASYYIGAENDSEELSNCFLTFWGLTHFMLYTALGFFCPDLFWETFAIGAGFEMYEFFKFDCHDSLDIIINTSGFAFGKYAIGYLAS